MIEQLKREVEIQSYLKYPQYVHACAFGVIVQTPNSQGINIIIKYQIYFTYLILLSQNI